MPDFKYGSGCLSLKLSKVHNYPFYAGTSLKTMYTQVGPLKLENNIASRGVIIRHLVLPNYIDNSLSVLYLIKDMIGTNIHINIMDQYRPYYNAHSDKNLKREISADEFNYILNKAKELGFNIIR
jgi:putative pyruvate formate lyase activating enzyme